MTTFAIYDDLGSGFDMSESDVAANVFVPLDPNIRIGLLTYTGGAATGPVTGSTAFDAVEIIYVPVDANDAQNQAIYVTRVAFGSQEGVRFTPVYAIENLHVYFGFTGPSNGLENAPIEWLKLSVDWNDSFAGNKYDDIMRR
jgi:hypothetical protein